MRVYETVLYASDLPAVLDFYVEALGLRTLEPPDEASLVFRLDDGGVLLIFDPERSEQPGRFVPPHGGHGPGHVAFAVDSLDSAAAELRERGVEIEKEIGWPPGGRSIYVRDPAGNSVELIEGEAWPP
jgi:catechol 2,3-dioxygenase-like lactoylglutathione lyase family enzyme